jgi:hypothetical protein
MIFRYASLNKSAVLDVNIFTILIAGTFFYKKNEKRKESPQGRHVPTAVLKSRRIGAAILKNAEGTLVCAFAITSGATRVRPEPWFECDASNVLEPLSMTYRYRPFPDLYLFFQGCSGFSDRPQFVKKVRIYGHHVTSIDKDTFLRIPGSTRIREGLKKKL